MSQAQGQSPEDELDLTSAWSIASTSHDLVFEHGRRFPNYRYGSQPFPRGDFLAAQNELALHNLMLCLYDDKLYISPVEHPRNVLDVRCGQHGLWARNVADTFPEAQVTGFDVFVPDTEGRQNLHYILQSYNDVWILDEITQSHGKLDFIYARSLFAGSQNFPAFYKQCFDYLEPGGYLEQTEVHPDCKCDDGHYRPDSIIRKLSDLIPDLDAVTNTKYGLASIMENFIRAAGFIDIKQRIDKVPWSPWVDAKSDPKGHRVGQLFQRFYETGLQGWMIQPCVQHLKYTPEQVNAECEKAFAELRQNDQHWYSFCYTVSARKPPASPP